jgi:putative membrane protein
VLTSLAAAPLAIGGAHAAFWPLLPIFIIGHVFWFIIIVLIVVFAIAGGRRRRRMWGAYGGHFGPWGGGAWGGSARAAETTLAERFANGDIDEKEYRARLEVLRANNGAQQPPR